MGKRQLAPILSLLAFLVLAGCTTLVERAEKAHYSAFVATDQFLRVERNLDNAGMRNEDMHRVAEEIRATAPQVFIDSFDLIQDYKAAESPEGRIELEEAIHLLQSIATKATTHLP